MAETITKILVPVDFSPHADRALAYATTLAQRFNATLGLVHVVEDPYATGAWSGEAHISNYGELLEGMIANAERQLATLKQSASAIGLTADMAVMTGRPADAIVAHAKSDGFDLIVMGTHGRTGLAHVVMGSVAEGVTRTAPCPVLVVHLGDAGTVKTASAAA